MPLTNLAPEPQTPAEKALFAFPAATRNGPDTTLYDRQAAQAPGWAHTGALSGRSCRSDLKGPSACLLHGEALALGPLLANVTPGSLQSDFPARPSLCSLDCSPQSVFIKNSACHSINSAFLGC